MVILQTESWVTTGVHWGSCVVPTVTCAAVTDKACVLLNCTAHAEDLSLERC